MYLEFEKAEPQQVRYGMDYNSRYTQIVSDDGWQLLGIIKINSFFMRSESHSYPFEWMVLGLYLFTILTFIYAIIKMMIENKRLKR